VKKWILHSTPPITPSLHQNRPDIARWMHKRYEHLLRPLAPTGNVVLHDRDLAVNLRSSRSRSKIRLDVCRCFFGRSLSDTRIASITPLNSSSFGRNGGFLRKYPGGTENFSIFETVLAFMAKRSTAARSLIPSIRTACLTCA